MNKVGTIWLGLALCISTPVVLAAPVYLVEEQPYLTTIDANNESGRRVGQSGNQPAMLISNNHLVTLEGIGRAYDINRHNVVVGIQDDRAFIYDPRVDPPLRLIPTLGGITNEAHGINDNGMVVGWSETTTGIYQAFSYNDNEANGMAAFDGASDRPSWVHALNNENPPLVAGASQTAGGTDHAAVFRLGQWYDRGALWNDIMGQNQTHASYAYAINDARIMVGKAELGPDVFRAFRYNPAASPAMDDLGTLGGPESEARDINALGHVVGWASVDDVTRHAFIYTDRLIDLNTLIPASSRWELIEANAINDHGQIVGNGQLNGQLRSFQLTPKTWLPVARPKIAASDGADGDEFGLVMAMAEDTIVVGAPSYSDTERDLTSSGAVYVYRRQGDNWLETKLTSSDSADNNLFGYAVAAEGDTVVVGEIFGDNPAGDGDTGAVYVYTFQNDQWEEEKILASDVRPGDRFGHAVALAGNTLAVGVPYWDGLAANIPHVGKVYIFERHNGQWLEQQVTASDGAALDRFGWSIAALEDVIVVGAPYADHVTSNTGAIYVYDRQDTQWVERPEEHTNGVYGQELGRSVAVTPKGMVVGTTAESVHIYPIFPGENDQWIVQEIRGKPNTGFGSSVAAVGDTIVVGASATLGEGATSYVGAAFVYRLLGEQWIKQKVLAVDGDYRHLFGYSVAVFGDTVAVGAQNADGERPGAGAVYPFQIMKTGSPFQNTELEVRLDTPDQVHVYSPFTYRIGVTNQGTADAAGIVLRHALPPNSIVSLEAYDSGHCSHNGRAILCEIQALGPGESVYFPITIEPNIQGQLSLQSEIVNFIDANEDNNRLIRAIDVVEGPPQLIIESPRPDEFLARTSPDTEFFIHFDVQGVLMSLSGDHVQWCLNTNPCVDHAGNAPINLGDIGNGSHKVTLKLVNSEGELLINDAFPEGIEITVPFIIDRPRVHILSPDPDQGDLVRQPGMDLRVAFVIEGWPLTQGRFMRWYLRRDGQLVDKGDHAEAIPLQFSDSLDDGNYSISMELHGDDGVVGLSDSKDFSIGL